MSKFSRNMATKAICKSCEKQTHTQNHEETFPKKAAIFPFNFSSICVSLCVCVLFTLYFSLYVFSSHFGASLKCQNRFFNLDSRADWLSVEFSSALLLLLHHFIVTALFLLILNAALLLLL